MKFQDWHPIHNPDIGRKVAYCPLHTRGILSHPDVKFGVLKAIYEKSNTIVLKIREQEDPVFVAIECVKFL